MALPPKRDFFMLRLSKVPDSFTLYVKKIRHRLLDTGLLSQQCYLSQRSKSISTPRAEEPSQLTGAIQLNLQNTMSDLFDDSTLD